MNSSARAHGRRLGFGALSLLVFALSAALVAGGAQAKPSGPGPGNSPNAKACQKDGWKDLTRDDGSAFASEGECTSYAARGFKFGEGPANQAPTAEDDFYVSLTRTVTFLAPGVLANDTDPDGPNTLTAVLVSAPLHGWLTLNDDGSFTYTAASPGITDSFTYKASDGAADSNIARVTITVA